MSDATGIASPSDLRDNARAITGMAAFQQWKAVLEGQMEGRKLKAVEPLKSMEECLERNYQNGEVAGLMMAIQMWENLIDAWDVDAKRAIAEEPRQQPEEKPDV